MNTKSKLLTLLAVSSGTAATIAAINKGIQISATSKNILKLPESLCYNWHLGNIHYTKTGNGNPVLLLHDLTSASSGYEWHALIPKLAFDHTVYTIDLLGCGRSEKPNMTYTNYLYVQLVSDFIKNVIGHRTDMIVTGASSPIAIMACSQNPDLFNRLLCINPDSLLSCSQTPSKQSKILKLILDCPLIGTLLYNMNTCRQTLEETISKEYYCNPYSMKSADVDSYYEAAHLGGSPKAVYSSIQCNYVKCNIVNALKKIDNSIYLVGGETVPHIAEQMNEYKIYNPAIETVLIPNTKYLPQLEDSDALFQVISTYFF